MKRVDKLNNWNKLSDKEKSDKIVNELDWEENKYIKERQVIDSNYEGYNKEDLLSEIKELEATNDILWEYISNKDIEEIKNKMEKIK